MRSEAICAVLMVQWLYNTRKGDSMTTQPQQLAVGGGALLYIGTADGLDVLRGDPARREWALAGRALAGHDISALAWDERMPELLFAGTAAGALLRSGAGGASWEPAGAGLPERKVWAIAPDPHGDAGALYAGVDGGHLFRSDDRGASWRELAGLRDLPDSDDWWGPFGPAIFHTIQPDARHAGRIYVGLSVVGVLASDDGGASWRDATGSIPRMPHLEREDGAHLADVHKLALHPSDPNRLYATTHYGTFRSDDAAHSWRSIGAGLPFETTRPIALHPRDPDTVYVICHDSGSDAELPAIHGQLCVHVSRDGGRSWHALSAGLPNQESCAVLREAFAIDAAEPCGLYLGTNRGQVFASADEGASWRQIAQVGASVRVIKVR
jgi:photosystem II stability/assembly factor-like uncharacterized protein